MKPEEIATRLEIPQEDLSTSVKDNEAGFIYDFINAKSIVKTLETGFAYGKSASYIIAASGSRHIAIDPFQDKYGRLGIKNIKALGFINKLELYEDYSHNVLPMLLKKGEKFEFVFIDGDHKFDGEFIDFYYADLLLEEEGYILLHDTWMRSTRLLMKFIKTNRTDYKKLPTAFRNFALYQKLDNDRRDGMHFKEFFTLKSLLSYHLILWMTGGKSSLLKKTLLYIKEKVK